MRYKNEFNKTTPEEIVEQVGKHSPFEFVDLNDCCARFTNGRYWLSLQADELFIKLNHVITFAEVLDEEYVITDEVPEDVD